jgi:hypothetical protein
MAVTINPPPTPETTGPEITPTPGPERQRPRKARTMLAWAAAIAAFVATGILIQSVVSDGDDRAPAIERIDAKDHPNYNPPEAVSAVWVERGDAKDHPNYNPPEAVSAVWVERGDAKDHPNYNPPEAPSS